MPSRGCVRVCVAVAKSRSWSLIPTSQSASSSKIKADDKFRLIILSSESQYSLKARKGSRDSSLLLDRVDVCAPAADGGVLEPPMIWTHRDSLVRNILA